MHRFIAYLGPALRPAALFTLTAPDDKESPSGGFGLGWYAADRLPARYLGERPMAADANLDGLGRGLESRLWMIHQHDARGGALRPVQPLARGEWLGAIDVGTGTPPSTLRRALLHRLAPRFEEELERFDPAELIFALLRQLLDDDEEMSVEEALRETLVTVEGLAGDAAMALNLTVSDGERLYLTRHATRGEAPPLYYTTDDEGFPEGQLAANHPAGDGGFWRPVPEGHLLVLDRDEPPELTPL